VVKHDSAVALDRLAEGDPVDFRDEGLQLGATDLKRELAPVLALKLQKVVSDEGRLSCAAVGASPSVATLRRLLESVRSGAVSGLTPRIERLRQKAVAAIGPGKQSKGKIKQARVVHSVL
jgi:hypothetical protein